jgi:hypothetical protein
MLKKIGMFCLAVVLGSGAALAQQGPRSPNESDIYCSGMFTSEAVARDSYVISGEESHFKTGFADPDYVFVNRGATHGVRVGDQFTIVRRVTDEGRIRWFKWQSGLARAMGTQYKDVGRVRVAVVHPNVSTAQIIFSCDQMLRGDLARPFAERPAPPLRTGNKFDRFAPPSGKPVGMVVTSKDYRQVIGQNDVVYVNLGTGQDVRVGDYVRFFRHQGTRHDLVYQHRNMHYTLYGYGSTPQRYRWNDLPREVLGEGIVLRVSPTASVVIITHSFRDVWLGDYVEIQ